MKRSRRVLETGRRMYGEIIRRRTRVRIVPERRDRPSDPPRFLLAPYRSGTTLFRYCLDSHPDLAVPPETDFLLDLFSVLSNEASLTGFNDLGYSTPDVVRKLGEFARSFHDAYAASKSASSGWLDKSPRYAEAPEVLSRVFPEARFVVLHRHPLDQIASFTRGGTFVHNTLGPVETGTALLEAAAHYWNDVTLALEAFAQEQRESVLTVRYEDLCDQPRVVLAAVTDHLGLRWSDQVLNYHKFDHDLGREAGRVAGTVGFKRSAGAWRTLPEDDVARMWAIVGDVASRHGYDLS